MRPALLVIDMQHWFFRTPERCVCLAELTKSINTLIQFFHDKKLPVIHFRSIQNAGEPNPVLLEGSKDADELPEIIKGTHDLYLTKPRHSVFIRTDLENILRNKGVDTLVLAGVWLHRCVGWTAIHGHDLDFNIVLPKQATWAHDPEEGEAMLNTLKYAFGIAPLSNEEIIAKLEREALEKPISI
jgi:nicotinamidase-related amidase